MTPQIRLTLVSSICITLFCLAPSPSTAAGAQQSSQVKVYETPNTQAPAAPRPGVEIIQQKAPDQKALASRKGSYSFKVDAGDWTDTGLVLAPGDQLTINATGTVTISDGRASSPDGLARGWKDLLRIYPLNSANSVALIGRIGPASVALPFVIGSAKTLDVAVAGDLFLRVNVSPDLTGTGEYQVKVVLGKTTAPAQSASTPDLSTLVSPALFSDIPRRVEDEQHNPGDMVNFALIGTPEQVKNAFTSAGWTGVDKTVQDALVSGLIATLAQKAYTAMPMSMLYLFGRPQDLSYAHADPITVAAIRHHLRIWKTEKTIDGRQLWVGSATYDNGFEKDQRNGKVTHSIDPDIDKERNFVQQSLSAAGGVAAAAYITPSDPLTTARTATGGSFHSDGRIVVMSLK